MLKHKQILRPPLVILGRQILAPESPTTEDCFEVTAQVKRALSRLLIIGG
jgi:hypothetical protein